MLLLHQSSISSLGLTDAIRKQTTPEACPLPLHLRALAFLLLSDASYLKTLSPKTVGMFLADPERNRTLDCGFGDRRVSTTPWTHVPPIKVRAAQSRWQIVSPRYGCAVPNIHPASGRSSSSRLDQGSSQAVHRRFKDMLVYLSGGAFHSRNVACVDAIECSPCTS